MKTASSSRSIGDVVTILYDPQHLGASVVVKSWLNIWAISIALGVMGSVFTALRTLIITRRIPALGVG